MGWTREAWLKTESGKATMALRAAAEKAGFGEALAAAGVEIVAYYAEACGAMPAGWHAHVETSEAYVREAEQEWTPELAAVTERAEKWLRAYGVKKGWMVG